MRKLIILALAVVLLGVSAYGGRRGYRAWKTQRAVAQAREAFAQSDYNKALLWLRTALKGNANNIEAVRMMGDFAELSQSPNAVLWRQRLVDITPASVTNRFLLARVATIHRDFVAATIALDGVRGDDRKSAEFHKFTAALAVATGQFQEAEAHFREASSLEPQNPLPKLNLAMILTQRTDPELAGQGRQILESLLTNKSVRADALRHLTLDALRQTNHPRALALAGELVRETNGVYSDRLLYLGVLSDSRSPQLSSMLAGFQREAATNAQQVFALSRWMINSRGPAETLAWLQLIQPAITTNLPVTMVVADTYQGLTNWAGLQGYVGRQYWGELEFLRSAILSRALREQKLAAASRLEWSKAVKSAEGRLERLQSLELQTANWVWVPELEEVLWLIVNKFPAEKRAFKALSDLLTLAGKTRSLLTLYAQEARLDPRNLAVKNNLASIALLLNSEQHRPHELARELYEQQKDNPIFVSTYAYSLHLQNKDAEALRLMSQLKPEYLEQPDIAGYYGLILAAGGDISGAQKYLNLAASARMLPEEAELFQRAKL